MSSTLQVEIWSDVVCPWCYIGKRRFEAAVAALQGELDVEIVYRPFQLDPTAPIGRPTPVADAYARKFGGPDQAAAIIRRLTSVAAADGLAFRMDRALRANTLAAHRLLWLAEQPDSPVAQDAVKERLLQAYFVDGLDVGDHEVLAELAAEVGFDHDAVLGFLDGDGGLLEVRAQLQAAYDQGITAVPTFVLDGQWAIPGAQDPDVFVQVMRRLHARRTEATAPVPEADADGSDRVCVDDVCEL